MYNETGSDSQGDSYPECVCVHVRVCVRVCGLVAWDIC